MENVTSYYYLEAMAHSFNSSGDSGGSSDLSFIYGGSCSPSSDSDLHELTANFQELTIDVGGMVRELFERNINRDTDSIRQEFIRNGIDSSMTEGSAATKRCHPPPGSGAVSKWPLSARGDGNRVDSPNLTDGKKDEPERQKTERSVSQSAARRKRSKENEDYCVFCYNNHENQETYLNHSCRDEDGFVVCPKLRKYVCPYCQATGRLAHTKKYCPKKPIITPDDLQSMTFPFGSGQGSSTGSGRNRGKKTLRF